MFKQTPNDPSAVVNTITKALEKIHLGNELSSDSLCKILYVNVQF